MRGNLLHEIFCIRPWGKPDIYLKSAGSRKTVSLVDGERKIWVYNLNRSMKMLAIIVIMYGGMIMLSYHVKIGLVPIRRDVTPRPGIFNWEKAEQRCAEAVAYIEEHFASENISFVDLKGINAVDVLYSDADVEAVVERFRAEKVDAVFLINGNFGNEEVAGAVAKAMGKPVLLWAPRIRYSSRTAPGIRTPSAGCSA